MLEHEPFISRVSPRMLGAALLSGGLVLSQAACSPDTQCGGEYSIDNKTSMRNRLIPTPDGNVDISYNTRDGRVVHLFLEKGSSHKNLTEEELKRRTAEFALTKTVLHVAIGESAVRVTCQQK